MGRPWEDRRRGAMPVKAKEPFCTYCGSRIELHSMKVRTDRGMTRVDVCGICRRDRLGFGGGK